MAEMYKRFIDDGFGVIKSNKKEFSECVFEFNSLRENICIDYDILEIKLHLWTDIYIQRK